MSPPVAVELFQSPPITEQQASAASFQNPNPTFTAFNNQNATNGFSSSSTSSFGSQAGPSVAGRARPRLVKIRKSQQSRSSKGGNKESEIGQAFNPFKSDSGQVNDAVSNDNAFVFGANNNRSEVKSEKQNCEITVEIGDKNNDQKVEDNVCGFVFSANRSDVEKRVNEGKVAIVGDSYVGFTFGGNKSEMEAKTTSNVEKGVSDEKVATSGDSNVGFIFGANKSETGAKPTSEVKVVFEDRSGKVDTLCGVVFGTNGSDVEKRVRNENVVTAGDADSNASFVFGAGWFSSGSGLNSENKENFADNGSWKKDYGDGVFIFRGGSDKVSSSSESAAAKCQDKMQSKNINFRNKKNVADYQKNNLNLNVNDNSGVGHNVSISSSTPSVFKLPNELEKLNINDFEYANAPNTTKDSCKDSCANAKNTFVFRGNKKPSDGSPETTSQDQMPEDEAAVVERNNKDNCNSSDTVLSNSHTKSNYFMENSSAEPFIFKSGCEDQRKGRTTKGKRSEKVGRKLKKPSLHKEWSDQGDVPKESNCEEYSNSPSCCSPMDFSPCQETIATDQYSEEASVPSTQSSHIDTNYVPSASYSTVTTEIKNTDICAAPGCDVKICDLKCSEPNGESYCYNCESCFARDYRSKGFVSGDEAACPNLKPEEVCNSSGSGVPLAEDGDRSNSEKQESNFRIQFGFDLGLGNEKQFTFSASAAFSAQGSFSSTKRQHRRKNRTKVGNETFIITPSSKAGEQFKQGAASSEAAYQEACEKWRFRGNQAYKNDDLSKAEYYYTQGINSVPSGDTSGCWVKPLVLCYSNRAATRISLGSIREALGDCTTAAALDPSFLKVYVRAANCHLMLGEVEIALQYFNKCLESGAVVCLDRRIMIEAADGLQKVQKVVDCISSSAKLLGQKTSDAAVAALEIIAEALPISSCSEKLLQMKAEALCVLRKYEEVIQLCEQTLDFAEKNFSSSGTINHSGNTNGSGCENFPLVRLWRWHLMSKSYFCMGMLDVALDLLQKLEQVELGQDKCSNEILESSKSLASTIHELVRRKNAGNEAVQSGRYAEAVEHYTVAVSNNVESRPFAAICFCNRAAAHQALGQIADAIADCSIAMALDRNYKKAVSRRAALHEMIRDYEQASSDLQRLISILKNQSDEKTKESGTSGKSPGTIKELRQAQRHLSSMQEEAKKGIPLDLYLILGIKQSETASEIKKAYRKAALRHHPDKAGQFLARSESGDFGQLWKEISQEVHKDADRLFKMIGEAYAVLSDTTKRSEYDLEEESKKASKESNGRNPYRRPSDDHTYPFGRSSSRRSWQESWKTYGNSYSRW